jgi:hypothetical protein
MIYLILWVGFTAHITVEKSINGKFIREEGRLYYNGDDSKV